MLYAGLVIIGMVAGTWGSIIGAGGGFILVPLLLFLFPEASPSVCTAISLFAVLATGLSATMAYARLKRIDYSMGILFAVAGIPTAVLGVLTVVTLTRTFFQVFFACLLIVVAFYLAFRRRGYTNNPEKAPRGSIPRSLVDRNGISYHYTVNFKLGTVITFCVGFLSSLFGIGGGLLNVPAMITILQIPVHVASATSQFILAVTSATAVSTHAVRGTLISGEWVYALLCAVGTIVGAQLGARISGRLTGTVIARLLSLTLAGLGIRLLWSAF
ncbi:MAG: sulfite exporter TauE/SafE family protein [Thermodesulfobacteriota bacterium]